MKAVSSACSNFSYYGLYLLDYLRTNKFEQADDTAFIRERADRCLLYTSYTICQDRMFRGMMILSNTATSR